MANKRGFVPCRKLGGGQSITKTYPVSASSNDAYYLGDFVIPKTTGKVSLLKANTALAVRPLGAIVGFLDQNGKPLTHKQPTSGPFLATAVPGYAMICLAGQGQTFAAEFGGNAADANVFGGVKVSAGAPNTSTGLSGQGLDATTITTSDAQFQVIGLAPEQYITNPRSSAAASAASCIVEVVVVNAALGNYLV